MACNIDLKLEKTAALVSLEAYCGTNRKLLKQIVDRVSDGVNAEGVHTPSASFVEWYKKKYKKDVNFNTDNPNQVRDEIVEYYKESVPSASDSVRNTQAAEVIATYGYTSAEARNDGKKVVTSVLLNTHITSLFKLDPKTPQGYNDMMNRSRSLAYGVVLKSELPREEKAIVVNAIRNSKSVEAIRAHLNTHGLKSNFDVYGKNVEYYKSVVKNLLRDELIARIAAQTGESEETIKSKLFKTITDEKGRPIQVPNKAYIDEALGGNNAILQDANLAATFVEVHQNTNDYFDELMYNSKLDFLRNDRQEEDDDDDDKKAVSAVEDEEGEDNVDDENPSNDDTDLTIGMYDHSGTYTSAMVHVNKDIKAFLDSLPVLHSDQENNGRPDYDLDNSLGIQTTMDANKCATVLYHYADVSNVDNFIQSIREIASSLPGFGGFKVLADSLESDSTIAFAFYTTFGKKVISKVQVTQDGGVRKLEITNKKSNKLDAFRQELFNCVRSSIPRQDYFYNIELVNKADKYLNTNAKYISKDKNSAFAKEAISKVYQILKHYYTNLEDYTISNFVYKHKNDNGDLDVVYNIGLLIERAKSCVEASKQSQANYNKMLDNMKDARDKNGEINRQRKELNDFGLSTKGLPELIDVESLYTRDYMDGKQTTAAIELSDLLVDYALIKVENNSINPLGNQSSDVINSSFITGMLEVLRNRAILQEYGTFKFQSQQYNFSNILLEHVDEDGDRTYGLFRKNADGTVTPTEYAEDLLSIALYSGARNYDEDKGITYPQHAKGDYLAAQFAAFNDVEKQTRSDKQKRNKNITFAGYFMRTPSDAPKNFVITAPKYSASNLFTILNKTEVDKRIRSIKEAMVAKGFSDDKSKNVVNQNAVTTKRVDSMINHLTKENNDIELPEWVTRGLENDKEYTIKFQYKPDGTTKEQDIYLVRGTYKDGILINSAFEGIYNNSLSNEVQDALNFELNKQLDKEGFIDRAINPKNILVKQLKNIFRQEVLDAAVAINKFFVTETTNVTDEQGKILYKKGGIILRDDNENVVWQEGLSHNGREIDGAYDNYHHKGGVIIEGEVGNEQLTGNVFHSDRFTIYDEDDNVIKNYGEELMQKLFNPLYGGVNGNFIHTIIDNNGNVVDVEITEEQDAIINQKLGEYIEHLVSDASTRLADFENVIGSKNLTTERIAEFMLNYQIAYNNFNDLFEGDSKFYKSAQDFLKRAKEVQGSGVPYGIANFAKCFTTERSVVRSPLASVVFEGGHTVQQYDKFVGVTVVNTVTQNENTLNTLKQTLIKAGTSEEQADKLISGFKNTTVNDAQSYITFDEWIRRITARGQLNKYKPLINKVLSGKELNGAELSEFIQVQKNFYYDQNYDITSGIFAPRQIKNAEFVLVPQLIKDTQLEVVAKLMQKYGIDQLNTEETSKAGKTNTLSIFDENTGEVHQDIINEINNKGLSEFGKKMNEVGRAKQLYSYEFLYTQQETPQHLDAENKAGIQIMKKILDNIDPSNEELYKHKQRFIECYTANIRESAKNLFTELGLTLDKNGNPKAKRNSKGDIVIDGLKYEVFYDKLKTELFRLGYDKNMIDYVTLDAVRADKNGNVTIMPNYMSMVGQKLESIAQSIFNRSITRQKLPGFHAAQITNVGFKSTGTQVSYSNELRYHTNKDGKYEDYIEIMLPASAFGFKRRNADGSLKPKGKIEENGKPTPGSLLEELYEAELQDVIGYRIPTEGKQSIAKMRVVGFIDDGFGSTIVVPNEWVAQTGSDFDIDSVYGIQHATYIGKDGKIKRYNGGETAASGLTRNERNNAIVDSMLAILSSPKSLEEILSRSNFEDISHKAKGNDPGGALQQVASKTFMNRRNGRSTYNVLDQADYQEDTMSGAKLKGFSVTRDNFCSVCNTVKPIVSSSKAIDVIYSYNVISYEDAVKRFGKENVTNYSNTRQVKITHNKFGWSLDNKNVVGKILTAYSSQTTAHILDAVKEGSVPNVNDFTFGVYKLFPDLGIDYKTAIAFMMQNGVTRIVREYNNSKSVYVNDTQKPVNQAIRQIAKELNIKTKEWAPITEILNEINTQYEDRVKLVLGIDKLTLKDEDLHIALDGERLKQNVSSPVEGIDGLIFDLGVILQYNKLKHLADEVGNLARVCNPDKFGAKQSIYATNKVFDDINDMLDDNEKSSLNVNGKSLLEAIYPDISKGVEKYMQSKNDDSAYPVLHTFLKYSTAPSIIINRTLFSTQTEAFRDYVKGLGDFLSNGRKLTEAQYKSFEKYLISSLYYESDRLVMPITYNRRATKNVWVSLIPKELKEDEKDAYITQAKAEERARIFGYRTTPEPTMLITKEDGSEEIVDFEIKDVSRPTQTDINNFARLTPAQKVDFIQQNFRDTGIFGNLLVNLFNVRDISGKKAGSQTIEFLEDTISKEDAYIQFEQAFTNRNPLIALAAYDLIKYAFIVEGYKMSKRGISKIIPNSVLYNDFGNNGTGLVSELNGSFNKLESFVEDDFNSAHIDYVRSHYKTLNIPFKYVTKVNKQGFELNRTNGMIFIPDLEENAGLLDKYKITYKQGDGSIVKTNAFVRLKFGNEAEALYRITTAKNGYLLYPVNPLEENEHGAFSSNSANWKYPSIEYYERIRRDLNNSSEIDKNAITVVSSNYNAADYKRKVNTETKKREGSIDFDMENPSSNDVGMVDNIKDQTQRFYSVAANRNKTMFMLDNNLSKHLLKAGKSAGLYQTLTIKHTINGEVVNENIPVNIYKLTQKELINSIQPYLGEGVNTPIDPVHQKYTGIIGYLRGLGITNVVKKQEDGKYKTVLDVFGIEPRQQDTQNATSITSKPKYSRLTEGRNATATDVAGDIFKSVNRVIAADAADADTIKVRQYWRDKSITFDKDSIEHNLFDIIRSGAEYITKRVESITNQLKYFVEDPNGDGYLAVNSPEVMDLIYKNPVLRNRLLKLILEAEAIVKNNMSILELDIKSQDTNLQNYLNKIREKLQELQNSNIIAEAQNLFANRHLRDLSTNPLIKQNLISVINGFYSTTWLESWIGDLQETPNSLLQIISKQVTSDIFAKEKLAQQRVKEFDKKIKELEKEAASHGLKIDWKNIVDENGRIIQNFEAKLVDDMTELREKVTSARDSYNRGEGNYRDYLEAKLEYDKWKLAHINQEIDDEYYRRRIALEDAMLHGVEPTPDEIALGAPRERSGAYPDIFVKYKELEARRRDIYSRVVNGYLDPYYLEELNKVTAEIDNLINDSYVNPLTNKVEHFRQEYDPNFNPLTGTPEERRIKIMYSAPSARALRNYIDKMIELNKEFFTRDVEFGFDEELTRNLNIIAARERRDANGNITVPMSELMEDPAYVAAKEWIAHSAKFVINDEGREDLNKAFAVLRKAGTRVELKRAIETHNAKDELGVVDATDFTDEEIDKIREEQIRDQNYHDSNIFSDRTLIKNASPSTVIYKPEFYAGLKTTGVNNRAWYDKVKEINTILEKYWDNEHKQVRLDWIPDTEEGRATLSKLGNLYQQLYAIKKKEGVTAEEVKKVVEFRDANVDTNLTEEEQDLFDAQQTMAYSKPGGANGAYGTAWNNCCYLSVDDGDGGTKRVINPYLFGSIHPKEEVADKWIDKDKTAAVNLINSTYVATPTEYYYRKVAEVSKQGKDAFNEWYYKNHIWNPSTREYEPIKCWTTYSYRDTTAAKGEWTPRWSNTRSSIKPEWKNKDYVPNVGHAMNYKKGTGYDNAKVANQNDYEKQLKTYIQDLLYSLVHTDSGLRYLNKGYLPSQHKAPATDAKFIGNEFLKALGWTTYHNGKEKFNEDVGYDTDRTINMPMLQLLDQYKAEKEIEKPVKRENESDEDFATREAEYEKQLKEARERVHREALNNNWEEVIRSFIVQASRFNAIQDNKYMLFYGKRMLEKIETYMTKYGGTSDFKTDALNSTENNPEYRSRKEKHLIQQYENWVRRLVYDEWKEARNGLTKWASRLQSLTSSQYMMMNIRGGIANVTLGNTQILAEAFAKEYFGGKAWAKGISLWNSSIISQFAKRDDDDSTSLADAIIKWFNVVDYDENVGKSRIVENPTMKGFNKFNRAMYSPQTIGENYMQNSVLFAMLYEHRVFEELDPKTNKRTIKFMNLAEYTREKELVTLKNFLTDSQKEKLDKMIEDAKADANKLKDYAWYKKDIVSEFVKYELDDNTQRKAYIAEREKMIKQAEKDFANAPSMMDQLSLGDDGYMQIKPGSLLANSEFNTTDENNPISDALQMLADFRGRVISVNKKIHGVYDKLGQAQLEKKWYGSLVMQYHKHIYPGMMKRWRVKGMYNEQRGTIEKGSYISLLQFLATPIDKMKHNKSLSSAEGEALKSIQNLFREIFDFCTHIGMYWSILPAYDQANIRRNLGDICGVVSAILLAMALRSIDDDDKEESIWYNLALYEADRLASESFQFNPIGMGAEWKKLWSTPIAAQSGLEDLVSTMGFISDWLFDEDFDPIYQSGRFAGQNKFIVRLKRRIPIYRGINTGIFEITESNHYYKMGQNMLNSKLVENMMEWVEEDNDEE